jgi:PHD/YefM family antitoxin component YafN of YafNO toxin-antitoxin module
MVTLFDRSGRASTAFGTLLGVGSAAIGLERTAKPRGAGQCSQIGSRKRLALLSAISCSYIRLPLLVRRIRDLRISSAEFLENYEALTDRPLSEPVTITRDGRDRLVLLSVEEYERLKRRDRRVYRIEEMNPEQLSALEKAEVPAEYAYLDEELKDWKP